jgi:hypothetical protein
MSIVFKTNNPNGLLAVFNQAIDNHLHSRSGPRVDTWRYVLHQQHHFYTHRSANWKDKAWLRADIETGQLAFYIRPFEGVRLTRDIYAYYAGHLTETFIRHFANTFSLAQTTPNVSGGDAAF